MDIIALIIASLISGARAKGGAVIGGSAGGAGGKCRTPSSSPDLLITNPISLFIIMLIKTFKTVKLFS